VLFATILIHLWQAGIPYVYKGGAISADVSQAARSFAHYGVIGLHGVPVNNNPPLDLRNDSYIHWPPLLPILLSTCFRVFGESEIVAHLFMLCVLLLNTLLVYKITKHLMGSRAAALAGFFWLTLPVVVDRAQIVLQQSLAVLFILTAIFCWLKAVQIDRLDWKWAAIGALAAFSGVLTSWETVLLVPGLWLAAVTGRGRDRRLATLYTFAIGLSLAGVITVYAFAQPDLFTDTLQTMKFRMGFSTSYSHRVIHHLTGKKADGGANEDFIPLCRLVRAPSGGFTVIGAGLTQYGTQEAGLILSSPEALSPILKQLPAGWRNHNLEIVLHGQIVGETPAVPELIASYVW
jgi:hypothetical protein